MIICYNELLFSHRVFSLWLIKLVLYHFLKTVRKNKHGMQQPCKNEQVNDFSNTAFTRHVDTVVRNLWLSGRISDIYLFEQCFSCDLRLKATMTHKFYIKFFIIYSALTNKSTERANQQYPHKGY